MHGCVRESPLARGKSIGTNLGCLLLLRSLVLRLDANPRANVEPQKEKLPGRGDNDRSQVPASADKLEGSPPFAVILTSLPPKKMWRTHVPKARAEHNMWFMPNLGDAERE